MVRHVLAIYRATAAGENAVREARAIAGEHGAQLTVAVVGGYPSRAGGCQLRDVRWDATLREEALQELSQARQALGPALAHMAVLEGRGPPAIAAAAERLRCDLIVVPMAQLAFRGGLARALRRRTAAQVIGVRSTGRRVRRCEPLGLG
jgi:nucleotide-binding universal stress UspA family protein